MVCDGFRLSVVWFVCGFGFRLICGFDVFWGFVWCWFGVGLWVWKKGISFVGVVWFWCWFESLLPKIERILAPDIIFFSECPTDRPDCFRGF